MSHHPLPKIIYVELYYIKTLTMFLIEVQCLEAGCHNVTILLSPLPSTAITMYIKR